MRNIRIISLVVALLVFMGAYLLWSGGSNGGSGGNLSGGTAVTAVVATSDIKPNTIITAEMLEVKEVAVLAEDTDYFTTAEDVVGRIAISDIFSGEKITSKRTLAKDASYGLSHKIGEGMRAFTLTIDTEKGFSNNLKVGDRIDVIISMTASSDQAGLELDRLFGADNPANSSLLRENMGSFYTVTSLQNIKIIALDMVTWYERGSGGSYSTLTFEVTPDQSRQFALLKSAEIPMFFTLRPVDDNQFLNEGRSELIKTKQENEKEQLQNQKTDTTNQTDAAAQTPANTAGNTTTQAGSQQTSGMSNGPN